MRIVRKSANSVKGFVLISNDICYVPLTKGKVAICDAKDYDLIKNKSWTYGNGYAYYTNNKVTPRQTVKMHQLLNPNWKMTDHKDRNKLNNRRNNFRRCNSKQNNRNRSKRSGTSSIYKGVRWDKSRDKWLAGIEVLGKSKTLGRFISERDAAMAYDTAAKKYFGEFAALNFK